jgi:tetratricopeptide (TPR) repeat protein
VIASHRWLGANTAVPLFYGQKKQAELTEQFLKNNVLTVDIFAVRKSSEGDINAPLIQNDFNKLEIRAGEELIADVVIFNRGAAHSFPPELRDLYEPWVEFEVIDKNDGRTIFHSGYVQPDGKVDGKAHVYKAILLDETGVPFTRHEVWLGTAKAYDNFIPPGRSDLARYRFRLPDSEKPQTILLRAKVNYRRFLDDYADYVATEFKTKMPNPTVEMAASETVLREAETIFATDKTGKPESNPLTPENAKLLARRWNDYGIGLLGQMQYGEASQAFRKASEIEPGNPNLLVNAAIAEMQTERFGPEKTQLAKATALLKQALKIAPENARVRYFWGINRKSSNLPEEAAGIFEILAKEFPNDREIQRQLGQALYRLGKYDAARRAFEEVIRIDPTDAGAYQYLSPLFAGAGMTDLSKEAQQKYLLWRDDPAADVVANKFYAAHPEWADVRVPGKIYGYDSPDRNHYFGQVFNGK